MGAKAGIDVEQLYRIVNGAAGASWMFTDRGKRMLSEDTEVKSALAIFVKDLDIVYAEAKKLACPIPVASAALQQFISGQSLGLGRLDDSQVVKVYENITKVPVVSKKGTNSAILEDNKLSGDVGKHVVVIGIGAMGGGMARALLDSSVTNLVIGYDKSTEAVDIFFQESQTANKAGKSPPQSLPESISKSTEFVILSLVNESQCEQVCFGEGDNLINLMPEGSCLILTSTVTGEPNFCSSLESKVVSNLTFMSRL
jgi:3-hydroxyisobutyrate dehydrogenase-like beta-hydroxyacid dehydrogenase